MSDPRPPDLEAALVQRARDGDPEALTSLLRLWQPALESIARSLHRRYGRLGFDTHDLVATSIRRLLRLRDGGHPENRDLVFLRHILRDAYSEKARAELRRRRRERVAAQDRPTEDRGPSMPSNAPIGRIEGLSGTAGGVTAEEWELVLLWKQGLSWKQIGEHLDVPPETARKRWHRMLRRLRGSMPASRSAEDEASAPGSRSPPAGDPRSDPTGDRAPPCDPQA